MQAFGCMRQQIAMFVDRTALDRNAVQTAAIAFSSPGAPSTIRNSDRRRPRATRSSSTVRQASVLVAAHALIARSTFWPSARTPMTASSEIDVASRSSRTRTTVPSRMKPYDRLIGQ